MSSGEGFMLPITFTTERLLGDVAWAAGERPEDFAMRAVEEGLPGVIAGGVGQMFDVTTLHSRPVLDLGLPKETRERLQQYAYYKDTSPEAVAYFALVSTLYLSLQSRAWA
jgi:hypothetical protein